MSGLSSSQGKGHHIWMSYHCA